MLNCALCCAALSGCAHASARTAPDVPALEVPAPPPRVVQAAGVEDDTPPQSTPLTAPLPQEPARQTPVRPRPAPPRSEARSPEPPRAGQSAGDAAGPAEAPPRPPAGGALQTTPTGAEGDVERAIRATLTRATGDLNRVDYRALNADARVQYDTAKRFAEQADEAIRSKNLVFAKNLADKAAALAAQLSGR